MGGVGIEQTSRYWTNFDYEYALFDPQYKRDQQPFRSINAEFEYIFLWQNSSTTELYCHHTYENDYLIYLQEVSGSLPRLTCECADALAWWGELENFELMKELNSKLTSTEMAIANGWCHPQTSIVQTLGQIREKVIEGTWLLRTPYSMSGRDSLIIDQQKLKGELFVTKIGTILKKHPLILDPLLDRVFDFGFSFRDNRVEVVQNLISYRGSFKGGVHLQSPYDNSLLSLIKISEEIRLRYLELGATDLQIDSFVYREQGELKLYPLVEVNARRTMGDFISYLSCYKESGNASVWLIINNSMLKKVNSFTQRCELLGERLYSWHSKTGIIPTSPIDLTFSSFYLIAPDLTSLEESIKYLWLILAKTNSPMPPEFKYHLQ